MINLQRFHTVALFLSWLRCWRVAVYWRPAYKDASWLNVNAPWVCFYTPWGRASVFLWELFNRQGPDFHYWGVVILKVNDRALFSATHEGVRAFYL